MRSVVTGGSGFLGRPLVAALAARGSCDTLVGDVREPASFDALGPAEVAFHLAAQVSVPKSVADPGSTWDVNANGTLRALEWARRTDVHRFVLLSSAHVYGRVSRSPIDEAHPIEPITPYGASKAAAEMLARAYHGTYGLDVVIVRPFNLYGPGQEVGYLVPDILGQIRGGKELILGDPAPTRDFTFVSDAVEFLLAAGATPGLAGRVFNLGSGEGHTVAEIAELAVKIAGSPLRPTYDRSRFREADLRELIVDNRAAREALGWAPRVSLEEGLRRTWASMA